jgi:adenylate cyclase
VDYELSRRVFRALGLPDLREDEVEFAAEDVEVVKALGFIISQGYSEEDILSVARTYGYGMSRIAQAEVRLFRKKFIDPVLADSGSMEEVADQLEPVVPQLLDLLDKLLDDIHRRHLAVALQEVTAGEVVQGTESRAVGFVDLVDFSRVSQELDPEDLGQFISAFEVIALEACVDHSAHLVKMIGDAAMFTASDPGCALRAAIAIVEQVATRSDIPPARAGVDYGQIVALGGDFFGAPVNVAARLTSFANPGTVVASEALIDTLAQPAHVSHIGKTRLKGVGSIRAFKVKAYPATEAVRETNTAEA